MSGTETYPLLREAYAILDGVPSKQFNLDFIGKNTKGHDVDANTCGTVGCAAGWLGLHPKFRELGIVTDKSGSLEPNAHSEGSCFYSQVVAQPLGLTTSEAAAIFAPKAGGIFLYGDFRNLQPSNWRDLSSKKVFQRRVKTFLKLKAEGAL